MLELKILLCKIRIFFFPQNTCPATFEFYATNLSDDCINFKCLVGKNILILEINIFTIFFHFCCASSVIVHFFSILLTAAYFFLHNFV